MLLLPSEDGFDLLNKGGGKVDRHISFEVENFEFLASHLLSPHLQHYNHLESQAPCYIVGFSLNTCLVHSDYFVSKNYWASTLARLSANIVGDGLRYDLSDASPFESFLVSLFDGAIFVVLIVILSRVAKDAKNGLSVHEVEPYCQLILSIK